MAKLFENCASSGCRLGAACLNALVCEEKTLHLRRSIPGTSIQSNLDVLFMKLTLLTCGSLYGVRLQSPPSLGQKAVKSPTGDHW